MKHIINQIIKIKPNQNHTYLSHTIQTKAHQPQNYIPHFINEFHQFAQFYWLLMTPYGFVHFGSYSDVLQTGECILKFLFIQINGNSMRIDNKQLFLQRMQISSEEGSVVITQDMPIVQAQDEKSSLNRFSKFVKKVAQNEWISEFDLFSVPLKLNFNGEDTYKTEFGGLVYLMIGVCSIVLTVMVQFPDGIVLNAPINFYSVSSDAGRTQSVFDHTNSFFNAYIVDVSTNTRIVGSNFSKYMVNMSMWSVVNEIPTQLELQVDAAAGVVSFNYSKLNSQASLYGLPNVNSPAGKLHFQYTMCPLKNLDPDCLSFYQNPNIFIISDISSFIETDGGIQQNRFNFPYAFTDSGKTIYYDRNQYTTNNNFFGFLANVLKYRMDYYTLGELPVDVRTYTFYKYNPNCASPQETSNRCYYIQYKCNGFNNIVTQDFDDITAPILFFLSVSQTIFLIVYLLFLKNYANNALKLRIADTLVYICQPNGKHYDFKSGFAVFIACFFHNHAFFEALDKLLYALCQTQYKKLLPLKAQLAIDMINYGEDCLDEGEFFGEINQIYSQQNVQPAKIIVDLQSEPKEEEEDVQEPERYFQDESKEQAFKRMCEQHQFYSAERKLYLKELLEETDKKYKLVLITQQIFERYRRKVEEENHTKEIELPIRFGDDEISGHDLKKENFN